MFFDKTAGTLFHIINIHTLGYITLNKYISGIASKGLPKVNMWATKCVTKRPLNVTKALFSLSVRSKSLPQKINILHG